MPDSTPYATYGKQAVRVAVVFLIAISLAASYALLASDGFTLDAIGSVLVTLYIAALVFYGVFWDAMDTRPFRIALYGGVIIWGLERFFLSGDESLLTYGLLIGGMAMFIRELYFKE